MTKKHSYNTDKFEEVIYPFIREMITHYTKRGKELRLGKNELRQFVWSMIMNHISFNFAIAKAFLDHDMEEYQKNLKKKE